MSELDDHVSDLNKSITEERYTMKNRMLWIESIMQELKYSNFRKEVKKYNNLSGVFTARGLLADKKRPENPFYFKDRSNGFLFNGYGDHAMYRLYAMLPINTLMIDEQGWNFNKLEFLSKAIEHKLSHRNSLLSSASTTLIVGRILHGRMEDADINLLRPGGDSSVRRKMLERHALNQTKKKDHNKEALQPYVASINFPKRFPIELKDTDPFPKSLRELEYRQLRRRLAMKPNLTNKFNPIRKSRIFVDPNKIFAEEIQFEPKFQDNSTQTTKEISLWQIGRDICHRKKNKIEKIKESFAEFYDTKKIPLQRYQFKTVYQYSDGRQNLRSFYDPQPKVETPWLTEMIENKTFTRRYYLENFREVLDGEESPNIDRKFTVNLLANEISFKQNK